MMLGRIGGGGEIRYDPDRSARAKAKRRLHPVRRKCRRIAQHVLVWVPSAIAAFVFFFFPVLTHLVHPSSRYLHGYTVPIPWTLTVLPSYRTMTDSLAIEVVVDSSGTGRFGITPLLFLVQPSWEAPPVSGMRFRDGSDDILQMMVADAQRRRIQLQVQHRRLKLGDIEVTCGQYRPYWGPIWPWHRPSDASIWRVDCQTSSAAEPRGFSASFYGHEEELQRFYRIVGGIRPAK